MNGPVNLIVEPRGLSVPLCPASRLVKLGEDKTGWTSVRRFTWVEWNLRKIDAHALSAEEVEAAFDRVLTLQERRDGSFQMVAEVPSGRRIQVIWRYDREDDEIPDVFGDLSEPAMFVITAY